MHRSRESKEFIAFKTRTKEQGLLIRSVSRYFFIFVYSIYTREYNELSIPPIVLITFLMEIKLLHSDVVDETSKPNSTIVTFNNNIRRTRLYIILVCYTEL